MRNEADKQAHRDWLEGQASDVMERARFWEERPDPVREISYSDFDRAEDRGEPIAGIEPEDTHCARGSLCLTSTHHAPDRGGVIGPFLESDSNGYDQWRWRDCHYYASMPDVFFCEDCILDLESPDPEECIIVSGEEHGFDYSVWRTANGFASIVERYELTRDVGIDRVWSEEQGEFPTFFQAWATMRLRLMTLAMNDMVAELQIAAAQLGEAGNRKENR